jgi:xanthine/uracil/vitamin C permease (AzgA family)
MVYIAFVNPTILAAAGMDKGAVFVATCLAAAFGSALMGLWARPRRALADRSRSGLLVGRTVLSRERHAGA